MQDGIYKATFNVGSNSGIGIVVFRGGYIGGGDDGFTYEGSYSANGLEVTGEVVVKQWDATVDNVFSGLTDFSLSFKGGAQGNGVHLVGATNAAPGQSVHVSLLKLR